MALNEKISEMNAGVVGDLAGTTTGIEVSSLFATVPVTFRSTLDLLRRTLFAAGTGYTTTDPLTCGILTATGASTITGTLGGVTTLTATTVAGTLSTAAQANVTSVGTLTALTVSGNVRATSPTAGIGYGTGAGLAVTQITGRTTGVTINAVCGTITLVSAAGSATWQTFTVTNSAVAIGDVVRVTQRSGADLNMIHVTATAAGSFNISFATTGGLTVEQPVFNFAVIKAVSA